MITLIVEFHEGTGFWAFRVEEDGRLIHWRPGFRTREFAEEIGDGYVCHYLGGVPIDEAAHKMSTFTQGDNAMNTWSKSAFTLDSIEGQIFEGFTRGETWNGWACPCFDRATAESVLRASEANGYAWEFDAERDAFLVRSADDPADYEPDVFPAVTARIDDNAVRLYAIGARSWTWQEVTQPA
ncbi:MAG: hypothetical protein SF123_24405 [Chloroflexota bacterium]|nr:hypothetical protein [Chloroflexota bacterium]